MFICDAPYLFSNTNVIPGSFHGEKDIKTAPIIIPCNCTVLPHIVAKVTYNSLLSLAQMGMCILPGQIICAP